MKKKIVVSINKDWLYKIGIACIFGGIFAALCYHYNKDVVSPYNQPGTYMFAFSFIFAIAATMIIRFSKKTIPSFKKRMAYAFGIFGLEILCAFIGALTQSVLVIGVLTIIVPLAMLFGALFKIETYAPVNNTYAVNSDSNHLKSAKTDEFINSLINENGDEGKDNV